MNRLQWIAISIAMTSCSSSAKPEPPSGRQPAAPPAAGLLADAAVVGTPPDAASTAPADDKHPRIFPWAAWRERNEKWLAMPSDDHCDARNNHHPRKKGESECYPPTSVQLAAIVTRQKFVDNDTKTIELTLDRGHLASVTADYFISLLDADGRPATRWVHPSEVQDDYSKLVIPYPHGLGLRAGKTHAAIVDSLSSDDQFPQNDPRSAP